MRANQMITTDTNTWIPQEFRERWAQYFRHRGAKGRAALLRKPLRTTPPPRAYSEIKRCPYCKAEFESKQKIAVCCSMACAKKYKIKKQKALKTIELPTISIDAILEHAKENDNDA
jgi:hypothetical protein